MLVMIMERTLLIHACSASPPSLHTQSTHTHTHQLVPSNPVNTHVGCGSASRLDSLRRCGLVSHAYAPPSSFLQLDSPMQS